MKNVRILRHYLLTLIESTILFKILLITCSIFFFFFFNGIHIVSKYRKRAKVQSVNHHSVYHQLHYTSQNRPGKIWKKAQYHKKAWKLNSGTALFDCPEITMGSNLFWKDKAKHVTLTQCLFSLSRKSRKYQHWEPSTNGSIVLSNFSPLKIEDLYLSFSCNSWEEGGGVTHPLRVPIFLCLPYRDARQQIQTRNLTVSQLSIDELCLHLSMIII